MSLLAFPAQKFGYNKPILANEAEYKKHPKQQIYIYNTPVLCFLELINGIDVETLDEYKRKIISDYINKNSIAQEHITKYILYFLDRTCRNLTESEVIYHVPQ